MTRRSFQKGYVRARQTKRGKVHTIRYRVRTADGKWRHKAETVNSPKRKDAERVLADRLREVNNGFVLPSEITFSEFAADHWKTYLQQNLKPSTRASHNSNLQKHLLPAFGTYRLSEITPIQLLAFFKAKADGKLSPKTRVNLYLLLQKMLNLAVALGFISVNPIQRVPKPKAERPEKPALTPEQVRSVVDHIPAEKRALFHLLYFTGLRIGEALGLKWSDVDFTNSTIHIRRSLWRGKEQTPKTRRSIRAKHLVPFLKQVLETQRTMSTYARPEDYVFTNGAGRPIDPDDLRKRVLYPAMKAAGIERGQARAYGFHLFRHSAGSQMQRATGDLKQTQSFLGHSGIGITGDVYVHLQPDSEIEALRKMEQGYLSSGDLCSIVLKPPRESAPEAAN